MLKKITCFLWAFFCLLALHGQKVFEPGTKIYIVRHAEKDTGNNPNLTKNGQDRAVLLATILANKKITEVYSTNTKRTIQTGTLAMGINQTQIILYATDSLFKNLKQQLLTQKTGKKNILIVGHSNTVCDIVRALGATNFTRQGLDDGEYDKLFILKVKRKKVTLKVQQFGQRYVPKTK
jgi:broad specificity phosphatase PhoE